MKKMKAKYPGSCTRCSKTFKVGTWILWSKESKARHLKCKKVNAKNAGVLLPGQRARFVTGR